MKKPWFKWDWLVKHDLTRLRMEEFEAKFKEDRRENIYYVFFNLIFNILGEKEQQSLKDIVELVEQKYRIPEHLSGKIHLYWRLHKFLKEIDIIDGEYQSFENFLKLKEDKIFQIVFSSEKNSKKYVLKEIKEIYGSTVPSERYDEAILNYFKAPYSTIADLKYLLNRINS